MHTAVRYCSFSGNTKKLADAIAAEVGVTAENVSVPLTERVDLLFLGSSLYKFGIDPSVRQFVEENADRIGAIALFGTSASGGSTFKQVFELTAQHGIAMEQRCFTCLGHFLFLHKDRPNAEDTQNAAAFARETLTAHH